MHRTHHENKGSKNDRKRKWLTSRKGGLFIKKRGDNAHIVSSRKGCHTLSIRIDKIITHTLV